LKRCSGHLCLSIAALIFCCAANTALGDGLKVVTQDAPGAVTLVSGSTASELYADPADLQPTAIAVHLLADDIHKVTGETLRIIDKPADLTGDAILVGTLGHSALIDQLAADGKIDVKNIRGQWEAYTLEVVNNPTPTIRRALVIAGSDRRGTAYGALTLSQAIGVSPWYWWADVPIAHKDSLFVLPPTESIEDKPVVKYRGIFLNDEAPALSGWTTEKFGGYNHMFYAHVFELLLRLKANYLWPAMWNNCFNEDDPLNPKLANDYGIVMGTSHVEPMMRADKEWGRAGYQANQWNYEKFPKELSTFWKEGLERNKPYDNLITIAMRGKIDTPMSETANIALLEKIVADQRKIIAEVINADVTKVPQVWALYKEVQEYYEKGMRVPGDVTLLWCDDNWGNVRRLPTPEERNRSGGAGIYYHFDYVGGPRNYKWLNTIPTTKIWEQMNLAHHYGADRIWIVNVGDLKPMELPISFFLAMAWNPDRITKENIADFTRQWATEQFGPEHADKIAEILDTYTKYNGRRKPELIDPGTFSLINYDEAERVAADWNALATEAEKLNDQLPKNARDAFYELVLYPTKACANLTNLYIAVGNNHLYATQGRAAANALAAEVRTRFQDDAALAAYFNHTIAHGKWPHMMDQTHIGYTGWQEPRTNVMPEAKEIAIPKEAAMGIAIEGSAAAWPGAKDQPALPVFDPFNNPSHTVDIFDRGQTHFTFTANTTAPWIVLSATTGTIDKQFPLAVTIDWSKLSAETADGEIQIADADTPPLTVKIHAINPHDITPDSLNGFIETNGYASIEAEHTTAQTATPTARWEKIPNYGRTLSSMSIFPVTALSTTSADSPRLEYRIYFLDTGDFTVDALLAPTLNFVPGRGLRYAISFDDQPPQIIDALAHHTQRDWEATVKDNIRHSQSHHILATKGYHTLKVSMVDPGIVLQKLVIDCGGLKPSYLGPPESFHHISP
jgi:hypothetical protein